jgi:hypothetical protein
VRFPHPHLLPHTKFLKIPFLGKFGSEVGSFESGEPLCQPSNQRQMEKLTSFSLDQCDKPANKKKTAHRRSQGRAMREQQRSPEQEEHKTLNTVEAKKPVLAIATSAQQICQWEQYSKRS